MYRARQPSATCHKQLIIGCFAFCPPARPPRLRFRSKVALHTQGMRAPTGTSRTLKPCNTKPSSQRPPASDHASKHTDRHTRHDCFPPELPAREGRGAAVPRSGTSAAMASVCEARAKLERKAPLVRTATHGASRAPSRKWHPRCPRRTGGSRSSGPTPLGFASAATSVWPACPSRTEPTSPPSR